jgi:hypothetical protein
MPTPTLVLDTIDRAQIQDATEGTRIIRTGYIKDIDTSVPPDEIFAQSVLVAGMPAYLSAYPHTLYSNALLHRRVIDTIPGVNNKVRVALYYEAGLATPPPSTFILTRDTSLVERSTELTPIGKVPIVIYATDGGGASLPPYVASVRYLAPFQRLIATGYFIGEPRYGLLALCGPAGSNPRQGAQLLDRTGVLESDD